MTEAETIRLANETQVKLSQILAGNADARWRWGQILEQVQELASSRDRTLLNLSRMLSERNCRVEQQEDLLHERSREISGLTQARSDLELSLQRMTEDRAGFRKLVDELEERLTSISTTLGLGTYPWEGILPKIKALVAENEKLHSEQTVGATVHKTLAEALGCEETATWGQLVEAAVRLRKDFTCQSVEKEELQASLGRAERFLASACITVGLRAEAWVLLTPTIQSLTHLDKERVALASECKDLRDKQAVNQKHQVQLAAGLGCGETSSWDFLISEAARIREKRKELSALLQEAVEAGKGLARENKMLLEDLTQYRTRLCDFFKLPLTAPWMELLPGIFQEVTDLRIKAEQHSSEPATLAEDCDRVVQQVIAEQENAKWDEKPAAFACEICGCLVSIKHLKQDDKRCLHCKRYPDQEATP